jgi:hypothetical protein
LRANRGVSPSLDTRTVSLLPTNTDSPCRNSNSLRLASLRTLLKVRALRGQAEESSSPVCSPSPSDDGGIWDPAECDEARCGHPLTLVKESATHQKSRRWQFPDTTTLPPVFNSLQYSTDRAGAQRSVPPATLTPLFTRYAAPNKKETRLTRQFLGKPRSRGQFCAAFHRQTRRQAVHRIQCS